MRLTVLGKSPAWQDAGGACSGYLIEESGTAVLIDCGNGVFGKLRARIDYLDVRAVVISHLHADHFLDLVPFSYALSYTPRREPGPAALQAGDDGPARPELHAPPGAAATFRRVVGAWGDEDLIEKAFDLHEYDPSSELEIGPVRITLKAVPHFTETFAMCISSRSGPGRIIYGADSRPTDALAEFASDADLILLEATLLHPERDGKRGHLTAGEAGDHARAVGARRLWLVHISDELDAESARREAEEAFGAPVEVAREGATFEVRRRAPRRRDGFDELAKGRRLTATASMKPPDQ